jgi:hypothetical protein
MKNCQMAKCPSKFIQYQWLRLGKALAEKSKIVANPFAQAFYDLAEIAKCLAL